MALGWGLWEGPARFSFWTRLFGVESFSFCPLQSLDFQRNWHSIRTDNEYLVVSIEKQQATPQVSAGPQSPLNQAAHCGIFRASTGEFAAATKRWPH